MTYTQPAILPSLPLRCVALPGDSRALFARPARRPPRFRWAVAGRLWKAERVTRNRALLSKIWAARCSARPCAPPGGCAPCHALALLVLGHGVPFARTRQVW